MNKQKADEHNETEVKILLSEDEALLFFEILCALPFRDTGSFDWEPPSEREEPVESVISQLQEQIFTHPNLVVIDRTIQGDIHK